MRLVYIQCGDGPVPESLSAEVIRTSAIPTRQELKPLDTIAREVLPEDPTPTLDEIAAMPDVDHLSAPSRPPQHPSEELRLLIDGTDAALSAVLTRMMRADYLWASVAYLPAEESAAAANWDLPIHREAALQLALEGKPRPVPIIRSDKGIVVAGQASITMPDGTAFEGEIIVDDDALVQQQEAPDDARFFGQFGARLVPMTDAPGIAAVRLTTPPAHIWAEGEPRGLVASISKKIAANLGPQQTQSYFETPALRWMVSRAPVRTGGVDPRSMLTGRALQCGGNKVLVTIDGVAAKRPVDRVTFYRHLRDGQIIRP